MSIDVLDETRTLPADLDAERALLGALMWDRRIHDQVSDTIGTGDWWQPAHEQVWNAITHLVVTGQACDAITVAAELTNRSQLAQVGGPTALLDMVEMANPANATAYARIVRDRAVQRRTIEAATKVRQIALEAGDDIEQMVEQAQAVLDAVDAGSRTQAVTVSDCLADLVDRIGTADLVGLPTPWTEVNRNLGGLQGGRLYCIGARPAVGKSLMAQGLAEHWATVHRQRVYFSTVEMPARELSMRMLAHASGVNLSSLKQGKYLTERDWTQIAAATTSMAETHARIEVCDDAVQSVASIRQGARTMAKRGGLGLVVVDYLQLLEPPTGSKNRNREREVAEMSRGLKRLAMELDVPVVVLSQLNRALTGRADKKPTMADLRESGAIEQDSDAILLLHQPEPDERPAELESLLVKNRDGQTGTGRLVAQGWVASIADRSAA